MYMLIQQHFTVVQHYCRLVEFSAVKDFQLDLACVLALFCSHVSLNKAIRAD